MIPSFSHFSLPFLPSTPSFPTRALLPELQRYKDTFRFTALGVQIPGHRQWQLDTQPWLCICWNRTFAYRSLILESQQKRIELVTRPTKNWKNPTPITWTSESILFWSAMSMTGSMKGRSSSSSYPMFIHLSFIITSREALLPGFRTKNFLSRFSQSVDKEKNHMGDQS